MKHLNVTTAVFPVAGMGTRFLPVTKSSPKEMLPIIDKPLIQYCVEEAIASGIKKLIFVTSYTKRAIEDYFDTQFELEARLELSGQHQMLAQLRNLLPDDVSIAFVRQPEPKGLGDAILCAAPLVAHEPFAVVLADDVIVSATQPCLKAMIELYQQDGNSVLAVERVPPEDTASYGIVCLGSEGCVRSIIEKPNSADAASDLGVIGRYVLSPAILPLLAQVLPGVGGEVQLTDAIAALLQVEKVVVHRLAGKRYDCGSKQGWFEATLDFADHYPELKAILMDKLSSMAVEEIA